MMFQNHKELESSSESTAFPMDSTSTCMPTLKELLAQGGKTLRAVQNSDKETHTPRVKRLHFADEFGGIPELEYQEMELRTAEVLSPPWSSSQENKSTTVFIPPIEKGQLQCIAEIHGAVPNPVKDSDVEEASKPLLDVNQKPALLPLRQVTMEELRSKFAIWHLKQVKKSGPPKTLPKPSEVLAHSVTSGQSSSLSPQDTPRVSPDRLDWNKDLLKTSTAEVPCCITDDTSRKERINPVDIFSRPTGGVNKDKPWPPDVQISDVSPGSITPTNDPNAIEVLEVVFSGPPLPKRLEVSPPDAEYDVPRLLPTCTKPEDNIPALVKECRTHLVGAHKTIILLKKARQSYLDRSNLCPYMTQHVVLYPLLVGNGDLDNMVSLIQQGFEACRLHNTSLDNPNAIIAVLKRVLETTLRIKELLKNYEAVITLKGYVLNHLKVLNKMADQLSCFGFPMADDSFLPCLSTVKK
jgi:hypothetical protein